MFNLEKRRLRETLEPLPVPTGAPRKLKRDFGQNPGGQNKGEWLATG